MHKTYLGPLQVISDIFGDSLDSTQENDLRRACVRTRNLPLRPVRVLFDTARS